MIIISIFTLFLRGFYFASCFFFISLKAKRWRAREHKAREGEMVNEND